MSDTLKNKARFSTTLNHDTKEKLEKYHKETQIPTSIIVDKAINSYIDNQTKK